MILSTPYVKCVSKRNSNKLFSDKVLMNSGKDCWNSCYKQQGPCKYCGSGLCCRKGWDDRSRGCDGSIGGDGYHSCALGNLLGK